MKERSLYLDVVKGLAIILVVVGHCIQFGSGADVLRSGVFFADPLFKFIYSFHMPLFMLVSGYLFRYSIQRPAAQVVIAKVRSIVLPLLPAHGICYLVNALESVGVLATAYAAYAVLKRYSLTRLLFLGGR